MSATTLTSGPSPLSLSCPFTPRDLETDRRCRRDSHHDWPFSSPLTCHPSGVSPSLIIPLEKTLNLSRGLKKAKKERGCTAKERISKMPPCAVSKRSSIYSGVTRHRWTGCYEAHLWDKITWNQIRRENKVSLSACVLSHPFDLPMCLLSVIGGTARFNTKQRKLFYQHYFPWAVRPGMQCNDLMNRSILVEMVYESLPSITYQSYGHGGASNDVLDFRMRKKKRTGKDFVKASKNSLNWDMQFMLGLSAIARGGNWKWMEMSSGCKLGFSLFHWSYRPRERLNIARGRGRGLALQEVEGGPQHCKGLREILNIARGQGRTQASVEAGSASFRAEGHDKRRSASNQSCSETRVTLQDTVPRLDLTPS
ncbi:hypothetical protein Fmac_019591 [Flemingia macrophylla]|uniref:Uncharacterized protein n=1 Tax=Flemingia macrophylla TaxID=520843 RepID=A0ABD1M875_9FABA